MRFILNNIREIKPFTHSTHRHISAKFVLVLLVFVGYFVFISYKYGVEEGFFVSWVTWSFFVLCTPIADAGLLIDFPLRLILKVRMFISEILAWSISISLNIVAYNFYPEVYDQTSILRIFKHIIEMPFMLYTIVLLSATGTFLSVKFGDELIDVIEHKDRVFKHKHDLKHNILITAFTFVVLLIIYDFFLEYAGINIVELI